MPIVGELVAGGVPEHVGMDREWKFGRFTRSGVGIIRTVSRPEAKSKGAARLARRHKLERQRAQPENSVPNNARPSYDGDQRDDYERPRPDALEKRRGSVRIGSHNVLANSSDCAWL
jgi:hypothetical protein